MKVNANLDGVRKKLKRLTSYLNRDVYEIVGTEAVNHFQDSFQKQGFTDKTFKPWKDVKRRTAGSHWYGFKYGSKRNYSDAATKRPILSGETQELMNSIQYKVNRARKRVTISSNVPYGQIHNEGGRMKVFGKGSAKMPQRQFMGKSKVLENKIIKEIKSDISKIMR